MAVTDMLCSRGEIVSARKSTWWCHVVSVCWCLLSCLQYASGACTQPLGVANAYITSTAPYNTGDRVYYRCYDRFTMSGTPSQLCLSGGTWSGTAPTCIANDESVTIRQTVTSPEDNNEWMMLAFGSFIGLVLLLLIILALIFFYFMYKRQATDEQRQTQTRTRFAFSNR